jgi:DNA-binding SARP family transcriptional activator
MGTERIDRLEISVLGSPSIEADGLPLRVDTRKAIALLVYLAVTERAQSRERLADLLWPDYDEARSRAALRRTLSTLRKALGDRWVSADRSGISLDPAGVALDAKILRDALKAQGSHDEGRTAPCAGCLRDLAAAADLAAGPFLQGFTLRDAAPFEDWVSMEEESIARELARALDKLVRGHTEAGDLDVATSFAKRKLTIDPLDEPAHRWLMQLYAWQGMRAAALQQYRECSAVLDRELGVSPLPETTAVYRSISEGRVESRPGNDLEKPSAPALTTSPRPDHYSLRGRERDWETMAEQYGRAAGGVTVTVLEGEAGIGKTRLASDFVASVAERYSVTVTARSHAGESALPYGLITQVLERLSDRPLGKSTAGSLAEASRLVPKLRPPGATLGSMDDLGGMTRFLEGLREVLTEALAGPRPAVVFLDDLHWCDQASLDVLSYLVRRLEDAHVFFIFSWRSEEVDQDHPLRRLSTEAPSGGSILLGRLEDDDVRALVKEATGGTEIDVEGLSARLFQETEGVPFFVTEYLKSARSEEGAWEMPVSIKELLQRRAGLVAHTARQILGTAAVIDRSFDFETVWRASGRTELETVDALDELVGHGLLIPVTDRSRDATYEFSHEKLRAFVYGALSPARRRVLHRRVGEALAGPSGGGVASVPALVARHLELGGAEDEAVRFYEIAATRARKVFANREALGHYLAALALDPSHHSLLHEGAGDMYVLLGEYDKAVGSYQTAAALSDAEKIPELENKLGEVHLRRGDWDLAKSHFSAALETLQEREDHPSHAKVLTGLSFAEYRRGSFDAAVDLARRALGAATRAEDLRAVAEAQNQLGLLESAGGRPEAAVIFLQQSLRSATERDDPAGRVAALNNLAHVERARGHLDQALTLSYEALEICARLGDSHREAALHNNIADLLHQTGDEEAAMEHLKEATTVLAQIGSGSEGLLPEVWKLVEW